ncbi:MAG: insulinase family protein [Desulfobacteraceae bacterium]|nr:insulinase family protein [Desulfobacteraceae bacterium]
MMKINAIGIKFSLLIALFMFSCVPKHQVGFSTNGIENDPALVHGVLSNGFQYVLMKNSTPKDRVSVHLNVFAGSVNETDEQQGVAHYLEHMLFNGSQHFKPGELIEYFQSIGMDFGADANASTSFFKTTYDLTLPKGNKQYLEDAFIVVKDYAGGALLLGSEIDKERGIILAEKRERDSVSYRTFKKELAFEMPGSLINQRFPIGMTSVIKTADRKLLKGFYDRWYRPDNMALVIVGDIDIQKTKEMIIKEFSSLQPREITSGKPGNIFWKSRKGISAFYHYEPEAGNTEITIERVLHTSFEPETVETLKQAVLGDFADSIFQNRLSRMVRKRSASFSSASVNSGTFLRNISLAVVNASCEPDKWKQSLGQLEQTLRQALEKGFLPQELARVKADFISRLDSDVLQAGTRKTSRLAQYILGAMNRQELFLSPLQKQKLLKPYIQGLTLEQVNQAFKKSWSDDQRLILVSGNAKISENKNLSAKKQILDLYRKSSAQSVKEFKGFESKSFPYLFPPQAKAGILNKKENIKGTGISQVNFQNKVRLNLKKTDFKKGEFLFKVVFGRGAASEPESVPGLSALAESTVRLSGFKSMDQDQIGAALAGKNVGIGFSINDNYFSLTGFGDSKEAKTIFELIYTYLNDPGFRSQGLALAKTHYRQMYEALKRTPDGIMRIRGNRFLANGDPRFGLLPPETIDKITLEEVENWLKPVFETSPIEVSIVGDFDSDTIIKYASTYLGALKTRVGSPRVDKLSHDVFFPKGKKLTLSVDTKIDEGMVQVAFLTDDFWDITKTRKLSMLAKVFSERLRKTVREKLGASYSPYVYNNPSLVYDGYGVMHVVVKVMPKTSDFIVKQVKKIAEDLSREGVGKKELELVKKPFLNQLTVLRQNNAYWLNSVMANCVNHPEKLDWANSILSCYASVTREDLTALAKQYLKPNGSALIVIAPKSKLIDPVK